MKSQNLSYRLKIIFGLFFIFPIMGFVYIGTLSGLLSKNYTLYYLLGVLVFSYLGFVMLKRIFDDIGNLSSKISSGDLASLKDSVSASSTAEMQSLVHSFTTIENQFQQSSLELAKRATELATLRELSDLCYMTFDPNEILYITLERSLLLTHSDLGSVMILEGADRKIFVVKATLGHGDIVRIDDEIDFETSIAKYAVINKSPLVVEDIEKDSRFGRANLDHYGTKSFICMPIKTSQSIIGVLTISRREEGRKYDLRDVESLTPLISNAAFTYENIRLIEENKRFARYPRAIEKLFKILNSSIQDRELLTAILTEMHNIAPFQYALVMLRDDSEPDQLSIFDLITSEPIKLARGNSYLMTDTLLDRVVRQDSTVEITHTDSLTSPVERELFVDQNAAPSHLFGLVRKSLAFWRYACRTEIFSMMYPT